MMIAIDGPAGAGKSTIARALAEKLHAVYIDTGAMYRALTLKAIRRNIQADDEASLVQLLEETTITLAPITDGLQKVMLDGEDVTKEIREEEINRLVSFVSRHPKVRRIMQARQQKLAEKGDVVMDGRDIGTIVLPHADMKFYLTASIQERARRRHKEYREKGKQTELEKTEKEIKERDTIDREREDSPLKKAEDAIEVDTTHLTIEQVVERLYSFCTSRL